MRTNSQTSYAIQFSSTVAAALVPLTVGTSAATPLTASGTTALVVVEEGTYGFLMTAAALTSGSFTVSTQLNPDPRNGCATTYVTMNVKFNSALTASCVTRDILIVPPLGASKDIELTITTPDRPVVLQLRNAVSGTLLGEVTANPNKRTVTLKYSNGSAAQRVLVRISGSGHNNLIPIEIEK